MKNLTRLICAFCFFSSLSLIAKEKVDYIVVGVGTAGATISKLLTDDLSTSVLAINIGQNLTQNPDVKYSQNGVFAVVSTMIGVSNFSQAGLTPPQPNADNRELPWSIAIPEGGASSINAGAWARGTDQPYAQWEAIAGPEWSVARISSIYKNLENYQGSTTNPGLRGTQGPVNIRQVPNPTKFQQIFSLAEVTATGFPLVVDYNDPATPIGISPEMQVTQRGSNGKFRVSSATAFLNKNVVTPSGQGVGGRKLQIKNQSTALRTIWKGNKAVGVEYYSDGKIKKAYAKKGVIVCAGLYSSAFLMHSGIGPKSDLKALGISLKYDNPNVGVLADQTIAATIFLTDPEDTPIEGNPCGTLPSGIDIDLSNPLKLLGIPNFSDLSYKEQLQSFLLCSGSEFPGNSIFSQISWFPDPTGDPTIRKVRIATVNPIPGIAFALVDLVQPLSRGRITLKSFNPFEPPVVNPGTLSNSDDLDLYVQAMQIYVKNINIALKAMNKKYHLIFPPEEILDDVNEVSAFIKEVVVPCQCWQSHCRMAPLDQGGVVDSSGKVYGVEHLYVADNSINPAPMDGTTMATGYLVAANIARLLLQQN